jgi:hypothetical protein
MDDDDRRAYNRAQKARRRAGSRGQNADRSADTDADKLADKLADIADRFADIADKIVSELARFEHQNSGATLTIPPQRGIGECEGAPVRVRGQDADNADADNADTRTRGDDPLIPDRTWPDPRRTQEHVDAAENGIAAARAELDRNRWHPSKGPGHA